jgi:hypothetical protein
MCEQQQLNKIYADSIAAIKVEIGKVVINMGVDNVTPVQMALVDSIDALTKAQKELLL